MRKEFKGEKVGGWIHTTAKLDVTGSGKKSTFFLSEKTCQFRKKKFFVSIFVVFPHSTIFGEHRPSSVKEICGKKWPKLNMKQDGVKVISTGDETFWLILLNHGGRQVNPTLFIGADTVGKSTFLRFFVENWLKILHKIANLREKTRKNQGYCFS